jgi:hypothetical protein
MSVGVQLTVKGSPFDLFWKLREVLKLRPDLRRAFDDLKLQYQGEPMDEYREAKSGFFRRVRRTAEFRNMSRREPAIVRQRADVRTASEPRPTRGGASSSTPTATATGRSGG